MKTRKQAWNEFNELLDNDEDFFNMWEAKKDEEKINNFFEWCSLYDDLKHITKGG